MDVWQTRTRRWGSETSEQEYWLSYSDLMAGLLMVFALLLLAALAHHGRLVEEAGDIAATRTRIVAVLDSLMTADSSGITVDPISGAVKFPDGVLFAQGQSTLQPAGREQLKTFAESYFGVLLGNEQVRAELKSIVIEGHTNDDASYEYNLDLSQRRAFSVMTYLLQNVPEYESELKTYVTANGRSFSNPIRCESEAVYDYPCEPGTVDKVKSRRIEILFRLKDEELLERIRRMLEIRA